MPIDSLSLSRSLFDYFYIIMGNKQQITLYQIIKGNITASWCLSFRASCIRFSSDCTEFGAISNMRIFKNKNISSQRDTAEEVNLNTDFWNPLTYPCTWFSSQQWLSLILSRGLYFVFDISGSWFISKIQQFIKAFCVDIMLHILGVSSNVWRFWWYFESLLLILCVISKFVISVLMLSLCPMFLCPRWCAE